MSFLESNFLIYLWFLNYTLVFFLQVKKKCKFYSFFVFLHFAQTFQLRSVSFYFTRYFKMICEFEKKGKISGKIIFFFITKFPLTVHVMFAGGLLAGVVQFVLTISPTAYLCFSTSTWGVPVGKSERWKEKKL